MVVFKKVIFNCDPKDAERMKALAEKNFRSISSQHRIAVSDFLKTNIEVKRK